MSTFGGKAKTSCHLKLMFVHYQFNTGQKNKAQYILGVWQQSTI